MSDFTLHALSPPWFLPPHRPTATQQIYHGWNHELKSLFSPFKLSHICHNKKTNLLKADFITQIKHTHTHTHTHTPTPMTRSQSLNILLSSNTNAFIHLTCYTLDIPPKCPDWNWILTVVILRDGTSEMISGLETGQRPAWVGLFVYFAIWGHNITLLWGYNSSKKPTWKQSSCYQTPN